MAWFQRRALRVLLAAAFLFSLLALPASAAVPAPSGTILDNATGKVGPLKYKLLDSAGRSFADEWRGNSKNENCLIFFDSDFLYFYRFSSSLSGKVRHVDGTHFHFEVSAPAAAFIQFSLKTGEPVKQEDGFHVGYYPMAGMVFSGNLIQYQAFLSAGVSVSGCTKIWSPVASSSQGSFTLLWDDSETPPPTPAPEPDNGILDWLQGFWNQFLDFIKGLFIPPDGYFEDWFQEIKDAFNKKVGGFGGLLEYIQQKFQALQDGKRKASALVIELPDNFFFKGFPGVKADALGMIGPLLSWVRNVLTAVVVVMTAVYIIRKIIQLVRN